MPADRIHVITIPHRSAADDTLWRRFCAVLGIDPNGFDLDVARSNTSLPQAEAEVLRRLNEALPDDLPWPEYERLIKQPVQHACRPRSPTGNDFGCHRAIARRCVR
ncbi:MAG: hypothetical protein WKF76_03460 [Nocardioidaceae bacterium]